ncbi:cellobiohydrolase II-I [Pterulicium gracile]|uniref:Glucanase n=1 Tax=Pterulicium gracile TaxID=1884261 RepID=A0A5C3QEE4_9AGAR|nr:cellobiohydrolase II-I [Pterula gracilis]
MYRLATLAALAAVVPLLASAQSAVYGQCGGIGWNGAKTCVAGSTCTAVNDWYSQCLPGGSGGTSNPGPSSPGPTSGGSTTPTSSGPGPTVSPDAGNPYTGYDVWLTPYYASEVSSAAAQMTDSAQKAKALKVAQIPTFTWFDVVAKVPILDTYLASAKAQQASTGRKTLVQIVVYDLPDRDCAAKASNGEFAIADGGLAKYKNYIDQIAATIKKYPDIRVVAVIEPDSLANMVTNMNVPKCAGAAAAYKEGTVYALKALNALGVYMYIDAGHAGWLGWPANIQPAATLYAQIYNDAGKPKYLRGLASNVSNYNALVAASPDPATQGNANYDESHYINAIAPMLRSAGFPAFFIVDQGRSGVQNIRPEWGHWCNVKGAGFGQRPTGNTGNQYIDQIVWIKPGGECDGTSNTQAVRYDSMCGVSSAHQNAPEAGQWFQAYFEMLVKNASPAL